MNTLDLSIKELAAFIGVSTDTIRRAVRKGEIPATRVRTALRFDLHNVLTCMRRNAEVRFGARSASAPGGESRPRAARNAPGLVTRGHYPQGSLQEFQGFHEFFVHTHY
jgi:excisionase family DNA binding protein